MKKLFLQQKLMKAKETFTVKNEMEEDCYLVEGDAIVVGGKKLHIKDMSGREIAMVQQKLLALLPKFLVFKNGEQVAEIVKKISLFKPKYVIEGPGWEVRGNIFEHDYIITDGSKDIVHLHKAWLSWGDSFELDISDNADEVMILASVLAIGCVMEAQSEAGAFNSEN